MKQQETPPSEFLTAKRKAHMLEIFEIRKTGIRSAGTCGNKVPLLHDVHFAAHLLDPYRSPVHDGDYMQQLYSHVSSHAAGIEPSERAEAMQVKVFEGYLCVRGMWAMER